MKLTLTFFFYVWLIIGLAVIDLDEFIWSPQSINISDVLRQHEAVSLVGMNWLWFGSSGLVEQPSLVVQSFIRRADTDWNKYPNLTAHYSVLKVYSLPSPNLSSPNLTDLPTDLTNWLLSRNASP